MSTLALEDFRSWPSVEIAFDPGVTVLAGANGQGKTNLVEAIGYAATLGSHRVSTDLPLVRRGTARAIVRVAVTASERQSLVEIEINAVGRNRARLNRAPVGRARDVVGRVRSVVFAPEDLVLVRGDPSERRRMLDELLVQLQPRYAAVRADYDRVLKQRNALLKSAAGRRNVELRTLEVWDQQLADSGGDLLAGRLRLVELLAPLARRAGAAISGGAAPVGLSYRSATPGIGEEPTLPPGSPEADGEDDGQPHQGKGREHLGRALLAEMARRRGDELDRGLSLVGPHRDDLVLSLGELPVRGHASHGEGWSVALALRLAAFDLLRQDGESPVLVLDDVFAELDVGRRTRLASIVASAEQVLITAAVPDDVPPALAGARFDVSDGSVSRVR